MNQQLRPSSISLTDFGTQNFVVLRRLAEHVSYSGGIFV